MAQSSNAIDILLSHISIHIPAKLPFHVSVKLQSFVAPSKHLSHGLLMSITTTTSTALSTLTSIISTPRDLPTFLFAFLLALIIHAVIVKRRMLTAAAEAGLLYVPLRDAESVILSSVSTSDRSSRSRLRNKIEGAESQACGNVGFAEQYGKGEGGGEWRTEVGNKKLSPYLGKGRRVRGIF